MLRRPIKMTGQVTRIVPPLGLLLVAFTLAPMTKAHADPYLFAFENESLGVKTPITLPDDGVNDGPGPLLATFDSPQGLGAFSFNNAGIGNFTLMTGVYLSANGYGYTLDITFPSALADLTLDFYLYGGPTALNYTLLDGGVDGTLVATGSAPETISDATPTLVEGVLSDTPAGVFDTIVLTAGPGAFIGIDNLSVDTPNPVPEPTSIALLTVGLLGGGAARRRRR